MGESAAAWRFTPPDGGARLASVCGETNTLVTLTPQHAAFTSIKLIHESARDIRRPLSKGGKRSVILAQPRRLHTLSGELIRLTDLSVLLAVSYSDVKQWTLSLEDKEVLMMTPLVLSQTIEEGLIGMKDLNILVIDSCHIIFKDVSLQMVMKQYSEFRSSCGPNLKAPRILALTFPLFVKDSLEKCTNPDTVKVHNVDDASARTEVVDGVEKTDNDRNEEALKASYDDVDDVRLNIHRQKGFTVAKRALINILEVNRPCCKIIELKDDAIVETAQDHTKAKIDTIDSEIITDEFKEDISDKADVDDTAIEAENEIVTPVNNEQMPDLKNINSEEQSSIVEDVVNAPIAADNVAVTDDGMQNFSSHEKEAKIDDPVAMYQRLECQLESLETLLHCKADLAEDVDGIKRLGDKPHELIIECEQQVSGNLPDDYKQLDSDIRQNITALSNFLHDHRFDLSEIYGDMEEFNNIPNPTLEPIDLLEQFIECLDQLGPYGADKAALCLLSRVEKLKVKIPYERHFLLLGLCTTIFTKVRQMTDLVFEDMECAMEKFTTYCTPKLNRLLELLKQFAPPDAAGKAAGGVADKTHTPLESSPTLELPLGQNVKGNTIAPVDRTTQESSPNVAKTDGPKPNDNVDECDFKGLEMKMEKLSLQEKSVAKDSSDRAAQPEAHAKKRPFASGWRPRGRGRDRNLNYNAMNPDALCGVIFVQRPLIAKVLHMLISEYSQCNADLSFVTAQYSAIDKPADPLSEPKDAEHQRKVQEEVLKRFRIHECNLLIATPVLEEGIDLPKCNLMLRWDAPNGYRSYVRCRARARAPRSIAAMLADGSLRCGSGAPNYTPSDLLLRRLATYAELDMMFQRKCGSRTRDEPKTEEELYADRFSQLVEAYSPSSSSEPSKKDPNEAIPIASNGGEANVSVNLAGAVSLINKYCAKLPSDTFTRLVPQSTVESVMLNGVEMFICTLRLPINCPVKYNIVGHPMPTQVLARRIAALQACRILHLSGELDNQLMPIGKENFTAVDAEWEAMLQVPPVPPATPQHSTPTAAPTSLDAPRPGTTKRRQYYFKRMARPLCDCRPRVDSEEVLMYALDARLQCPLPERHNTRGRRLHAPEMAASSLAILTRKPINKIPGFPIYTRSGEVGIQIRYAGHYSNSELPARGNQSVPGQGQKLDSKLTPHRLALIHSFMRYLFGNVLRVRRQGMPLDVRAIRRAGDYYIVPTVNETDANCTVSTKIDWDFLELIHSVWRSSQANSAYPNPDPSPKCLANPNLHDGDAFAFDAEKYRDAVVTPWYRNHDQPQYFYVAEICSQLSPQSAFPQPSHESFAAYYRSKYSVAVTHLEQPLLDVDHTSARLNLLTPRYVSRKGVALPISSERTRRAKRDRLDQKQILVPELCSVHPFSGALWRCAVALPCILYRINALLLADEIRRCVALEIGVGTPDLSEGSFSSFEWPPLNFGWCLADVLRDDKDKIESCDLKLSTQDPSDGLPADLGSVTEGSNESAVTGDREKTANELFLEMENQDASAFEIGMWSNEIAEHAEKASRTYPDSRLEKLPPNLTMCTADITGVGGWGDPVGGPPFGGSSKNDSSRRYNMADSDLSYMSSDFDTSFDSDVDSDIESDCGVEVESGIMQGVPSCGVRIEFKSYHEAEAIDIVSTVAKLDAVQADNGSHVETSVKAEEVENEESLQHFIEYFYSDAEATDDSGIQEHIEKFKTAVLNHEQHIRTNGTLIASNRLLGDVLQRIKSRRASPDASPVTDVKTAPETDSLKLYDELFRGGDIDYANIRKAVVKNDKVTLTDLERNKAILVERIKQSLPEKQWQGLNCFSMNAVETPTLNVPMEIGYVSQHGDRWAPREAGPKDWFDFDHQPNLVGHPGPSPSAILQALTMSNANDGINLERLETIGDSFLKYAITAYLYCVRSHVHEGKLSHMRSKQVSNLNLYRLGRAKRLGSVMIATKFEPHDNWLPPSHRAPKGASSQMHQINEYAFTNHDALLASERIWAKIYEDYNEKCPQHGLNAIKRKAGLISSSGVAQQPEVCTCRSEDRSQEADLDSDNPYFVPYNLITQHSIPDKSVADCVEALIGAYLIECGPRGALLFMSWLGIKVLPKYDIELAPDHPYVQRMTNEHPRTASVDTDASAQRTESQSPRSQEDPDSDLEEEWTEAERCEGLDEEPFQENWSWPDRIPGSLKPYRSSDGTWYQTVYGSLVAPPSPLLRHVRDPEGELDKMLSGYEKLEGTLKYRFNDRALALQAMTHASHSHNKLTDCYQRLEFLGDAVLDYLITRFLYEDKRRHSPGALTDLRSALVNNTIFASLAVRHGFHKYFRHMSPGLNEVLSKFVRIQEENGHSISEEHYLIQEDELEQAEDVEVPKALGDLFESIAGAIYLDSGLSLSAVWKVYHGLMAPELEAFSASVPKSPVRELLEAEPETAKFGKPERLADGRRVRVTVEVFGRGTFKGVGRNYRIAKCTAARCALRHLAKPVPPDAKYRGR